MKTPERVKRAEELCAEGATYREIAEELGLKDPRQAWRWLNPEALRAENKRRRAKKREWESGKCPECGGYMGSAKRSDTQVCEFCRAEENERMFKARARRFIELREEGWLNSEIEDYEGLSYNTVAVTLKDARKRGMDVPRSPYFKALA